MISFLKLRLATYAALVSAFVAVILWLHFAYDLPEWKQETGAAIVLAGTMILVDQIVRRIRRR
jgi:hypothetical protein